MPSFARVYTPRYRAHYLAAGLLHSITIRDARDETVPAIVLNGRTCLHDVFDLLPTLLPTDFSWISAEVAQQDEETFVPCDIPEATVGTADWTDPLWSAMKRVSALTFTGIGHGSRTSIHIFGLDINTDLATDLGATGIIYPAILSAVDDIAGALTTRAHAVNGTLATFRNAATYKVNDALLNDLARSGIVSPPPGP